MGVRAVAAPPGPAAPAAAAAPPAFTAQPASAVPSAALRHDLPTLTALRAAAALLVFAVHVDPGGPLALGGRSGVSFFFILSGFVLTWSAAPQLAAPRFWRRRCARIVPAYLLAWLLGILVALAEAGWHADPVTLLPGTFLMQAWAPATSVHFAADGVCWSVSCELFFYLLFPLLLRAGRRLTTPGLWWCGLGLLALGVGVPALVRSSDPNHFWTYIFPPARLPEFALGMLAALAVQRGLRVRLPRPWAAGVALAAAGAACTAPAWGSTVAVTVVPYLLLVVAAASADLGHQRALPPLLVTFGAWSYAFYLLHQLVIRALQLADAHLPVGVLALAALGLSTGLAWLVHTVVERPALRALGP